ncbi:MAG: N4-gp56 family major capsid protein [Firmicutes bacterium HGW-Firmicutes-15]|nr:MAG: N4-gp56 family major capsid protein [Firmicutes bacterium HGW-Firmicutes-15]
MAIGQTYITDLIDPEVISQLIIENLPKEIKFAPLAIIDNTLVGQSGDTISIPTWEYIGDAEVVAAGEDVPMTVLKATTTPAIIVKYGKGVKLNDEAVLSGYGDPIGNAVKQTTEAIGAGIDNACLTALKTTTLTFGVAASTVMNYDNIALATDEFAKQDDEIKVLIVNPRYIASMRKDYTMWMTKEKMTVAPINASIIGEYAGCQVMPSDKIAEESSGVGGADKFFTNLIVKPGALGIFIKRDVVVETDKDIIAGVTVIVANEHAVAVLVDPNKSVKFITKK